MNRILRLQFTKLFATELEYHFPEFRAVKIQSMYLWAGEAVWAKKTDGCHYFILLCPDPKGQRDEMTIELGWSRKKRFPELMQRPSIVLAKDIAHPEQHDEATIRLGSLGPDPWDFKRVWMERMPDVVSFFIDKLRDDGMPFLARVGQRGIVAVDDPRPI